MPPTGVHGFAVEIERQPGMGVFPCKVVVNTMEPGYIRSRRHEPLWRSSFFPVT